MTSSYLDIAAELRDLEILKSISYNNLNKEIFVFFADQYYQIKESDQRKFQEV